ncbi:hypothetical protein HCU40_25465 [Pseudanabaena biceps]|nr:hypothetical protein [Pseudanabaena biceps]
MSGFFLLFVVGAYLSVVLVEVLRGAERMQRHPSGNRGFLADVALTNGWLVAFAAAAGTALSVAVPSDSVAGWVVPNAIGLVAAVLFSMLPPVTAARQRLKALAEVTA